METPPFEVKIDLAGWALLWADVDAAPGADATPLLRRVTDEVRRDREVSELSSGPVLSALRTLFRAAGTDPTRYRTASEALLRRVLKGSDLPLIHPLVDLNNALSLRLAVPCCVMAAGTTDPPYRLRAGRAGESYRSLRGPFDLEGRPLLVDAHGPCDTPITGNERVKVEPTTRRAWLVAYLPATEVDPDEAAAALREMAGEVEGVTVRAVYAC